MDLQELHQTITHSSVSANNIRSRSPENESFWGKDGFTFGDVLDMVNPLHHLPIVSKYYREQSHDDACEGAKLLGGALFGGLLGGVTGVLTSIANSAIRHETHQDMSEHLLAMADKSMNIKQYDTKAIDKLEFRAGKNELLVNNSHVNPFFAEALHDASDSEFYSNYTEHHLANRKEQRGKSWGEV